MPTLQELYPWLPVNILPQESINALENTNNIPTSPIPGTFNPATDYQYVLNTTYFDLNTSTLGLSGTTPTGDPVQFPLSQSAQDVILRSPSPQTIDYLTGLNLEYASLQGKQQGGIDMMTLLIIIMLMNN